MLTDQQRGALVAELQTTKGMWSNMPDGEHTIRGYGEHLDVFTPDEIRAGFRVARLKAEHTYPKIGAIVDACNSVCQSHRAFRFDRPEGDDKVTACCDGHIVMQTWKVVPNRFTLGYRAGMTVDRFGIWHTSDCPRPVLNSWPSLVHTATWENVA